MKKWIVFMICACLSEVMAHADTYPYLTFLQTDGTSISVSASSLTITFSNGKLIATYGTESKELTITNLASMYFSETEATTSIKEIAITNADGKVKVYSLQGICIGMFDNIQSINEKLPIGLYIMKAANGKVSKIAVK